MKLAPEQLLPEELNVMEDDALNCPDDRGDDSSTGICLHCQEKIKLLRHIAWLNEIIEDLWEEYVNG